MRVRFHHLDVALEGEGPALDAGRTLLAGFPPSDGTGPADLVIRMRDSAPRPRLPSPRDFFHGAIDCHADGGDVLLSDGQSRSRVHAGGRLVELEVAEGSLRNLHLFAQVFLLISVVLALRWRGLFHVHAGALVAPGGAPILVAGSAGAGKSTLTLALVEAGCGFLGDDAVFLGLRDGVPVLHALPRPFHVGPATAAAFPRLVPLLGTLLPNGDKRNLDPEAAWPGRAVAEAGAPATVLLPGVEDRADTRVEAVGAAEGLGALIESSTYVVVDDLPARRAHLEALRRVADGARTFRVRLGRDLLAAPAAVAGEILASAGVGSR